MRSQKVHNTIQCLLLVTLFSFVINNGLSHIALLKACSKEMVKLQGSSDESEKEGDRKKSGKDPEIRNQFRSLSYFLLSSKESDQEIPKQNMFSIHNVEIPTPPPEPSIFSIS
ncbi:MAG: hypothetical protein IPL46_28910 [Saprospiraceae bacterium]|nr:hypothetical protein [Saprospiraceae bacterium]